MLVVALSVSSSLESLLGQRQLLLLIGNLDEHQLEHDPWCQVGKILDLVSIVWLVLKGEVHWEPCVDVGAPNVITLVDCLVSLKMATSDKFPLSLVVDASNKVVNQHSRIQLRWHAIWLLSRLAKPFDGIPDVVKAVVGHTHLMQVVGGEEFWVSSAAL